MVLDGNKKRSTRMTDEDVIAMFSIALDIRPTIAQHGKKKKSWTELARLLEERQGYEKGTRTVRQVQDNFEKEYQEFKE
jgi:hypothetical protein